MAIGYNLSITNDNEIHIGNNDIMSISGIVGWTTTSDGRLKTNIREDITGLDFIMKLRPVTYDFRFTISDFGTKLSKRYTGFIAQEVEEIVPDLTGVDSKGFMTVNYLGTTALLVEAIKEQQKIINELKKKVDSLSK